MSRNDGEMRRDKALFHHYHAQGANRPIFVKTDMVCCKRLLYSIWLDSLDPLQQLLGGQPF